ncbi:splicing factor, suppressor of white-apricot homolog isoform X1, partial [Tanacetum coccineum]
MNIEIHGRHALLFDDDATSSFVNSEDALVEWNSLLIDRYDVRHLLSAPPPSRRRRNPQTSHSSSADAEIDYERYLDLPSQNEEH